MKIFDVYRNPTPKNVEERGAKVYVCRSYLVSLSVFVNAYNLKFRKNLYCKSCLKVYAKADLAMPE